MVFRLLALSLALPSFLLLVFFPSRASSSYTRILHQIRFSIKFVLVGCRSYGLYCLNVIYTFYFHFIIHKTSISYCLYYNTAKICMCMCLCVFCLARVYISSLRCYIGMAVCCWLTSWLTCHSRSIFHIARKRNRTVRRNERDSSQNANSNNGGSSQQWQYNSLGKLTSFFYYFSFWQYADEIWCMFNVFEMQGTRPNKNDADIASTKPLLPLPPFLAFKLQNNKNDTNKISPAERSMRLTKEILKELHSRLTFASGCARVCLYQYSGRIV